jgi:hypothetical protein
MNTASLPIVITAVLALGACKGGNGDASVQPIDFGTEPKKVQRPAVDTQQLKSPCDWLTREEAKEMLPPLAGEPYLVTDSENVRADPSGRACAYPVTTARGIADVAIQVDPQGALHLESATDVMAGVVARELSEDGHGEAPAAQQRTDGWDFAEWVVEQHSYRTGHLAIVIGDRATAMKDPAHDRIAAHLRGKIADKPFANPGSDPNAPGYEPDPCELLTRAEAEAVLGPLAVAPYRSFKASALADGNGLSCTYYTAGHHTFVVRPTYYEGKEDFQMIAGLGGLLRSGVGGADEGDLVDGPWDSATAGTAGELCVLKGDAMLTVVYRTSSTDIEGAAKLAAIAVPRLEAQ